MKIVRIVHVIVCLLTFAAPAASADDARGLRLDVTRDAWFSEVGPEGDGSNGGAPRLKLKSYQEMSLIDFDTRPLRGRVVAGATLHLQSAGEPRLKRVTVGSFGADWVEGTASEYQPQKGSSTFKHRRHPDTPWTVTGSDLDSVMLGQGGTTWRTADATPPDGRGWQAVAVDPAIVAARVAGISYGFLLFDDTGSEFSRKGDTFTPIPFPNRFVFSKDQNRSVAPYLMVTLGPEDKQAPAAPSGLKVDPGDLPAGEAFVSWTTPADRGPAGTIGFFVRVDGQEVPRYLIPLAGAAGGRVTMHLRDLDLKPGAEVALEVRAVDGAGNLGPATKGKARVSAREPLPLPPTVEARSGDPQGEWPSLGTVKVAIVDEQDKVAPETGATIPEQPGPYFVANHLWDARTRQLELFAAKNEFVGFQVVLRGDAGAVAPALSFEGPGAGKPTAEFGRIRNVSTPKGPLPDPIVPFDRTPRGESRKGSSLYGEVYVPHDARAGMHRGTLTLKAGGRTLDIGVRLRVWDFTLPDHLSFLPDMNCYDLPANDLDYYRLAHRHRTVLNRVPYHHRGDVADGFAPKIQGGRFDWTAWDRRFGPMFDGSAFADLPRKRVPIECFYLPLFENWPTPIEPHYNGDSWADRAFDAEYRRAFVAASRAFADHIREKGWNETLFQCFFNGKNDFKRNGWSRATSPWLLDEPAHLQDFLALRYFGAAFHEGIRGHEGKAKLVFRADISRPQWQRDTLDGLLDYNVVGGAMRPYHRIVLDRKREQGQVVVEYGSTNAVDEANTQPVGWSLDAWALGMDGVLPWQTVGGAESWTKADTLSLFYPSPDGRGGPFPSIRLKAFRRGQQDVEYLTLWTILTRQPRWAVGRRVRESLQLVGERKGSGFNGGEDAGVVHYDRLRPRDLWALRVRIAQALDSAHPAARSRLLDLRTPPRDPSQLPDRMARQ
ncbi:MAG TPA: hypothetical protein VG406_13885 [Isosphaeraceae bacterium]|jgi:hypothetical protein|nr:hypothetical protein [Isosphaeraceae bacterium]